MGLDITLYRFKDKVNKGEKRSNYYEHVLEKDEIEGLKKAGLTKYIKRKVNSYFDFEKFGITDEKYEWASTCYNGDAVFKFIDKSHELYPIYKKIHQNPKYVPSEKEMSLLEKYGYEPDKGYTIGGFLYYETPLYVEFYGKDIPIKKVTDKVIRGNEIGYQRKGLNRRFYDEWKDEQYLVIDKERIQYIYDNCCIEDSDYDYKEHFKSEILDNFVEGETFCTFSW